jgi:hypothetical protein
VRGLESCGHCCHTDSLLELWRAGWLERPEAERAEQTAGISPTFDNWTAEEHQAYAEWCAPA